MNWGDFACFTIGLACFALVVHVYGPWALVATGVSALGIVIREITTA